MAGRPFREVPRAFVPTVGLEKIQQRSCPIFQRQRIQKFDGIGGGRDAHVIWLLACQKTASQEPSILTPGIGRPLLMKSAAEATMHSAVFVRKYSRMCR